MHYNTAVSVLLLLQSTICCKKNWWRLVSALGKLACFITTQILIDANELDSLLRADNSYAYGKCQPSVTWSVLMVSEISGLKSNGIAYFGQTTVLSATFLQCLKVLNIVMLPISCLQHTWGEGKITYLLSATFRHQFISNKQKQESLTSFLCKVTSFSAVKYDVSGD